MSIRVGQARLQACERERLEPEGPREPYWAWVSDVIESKGGRSEWFAPRDGHGMRDEGR